MAVDKYTALAQITLTSSASSVTFGSIPSGYRDLRLVFNGTIASGIVDLTVNSDSANRSSVYAYGLPTTSTNSYTDTTFQDITSNSSERVNVYEIMDYSATDKHKTILARMNIGTTVVAMMAGRWASLSAVNTVTLTKSGSFAIGSTFKLFGVK